MKQKVTLSPREIQVIECVYAEMNSHETGLSLGISKRTVESIRMSISRKVKSNTTVGLTKFAIANKIVPAPKK